MCFAIPYRIQKRNGDKATLEDGRIIDVHHNTSLEIGSYVRLAGDVIVDTLSKQEGIKIRHLIKSLHN